VILSLGGTGADCEKWVRGARYALREMALEDLLDEIRGSQLTLPPDALRRCAIHEAGHALIVILKRPGKLVKVTVRQTSTSGGGASVLPDEDPLLTRTKVADELVQLLAGRAAEEVLLGDERWSVRAPQYERGVPSCLSYAYGRNKKGAANCRPFR
jgi:hypothetical protein